MAADSIELEFAPPIAWLWLNRPQRANAIDRAMVDQFAASVTELEKRQDIRAVFVRGREGKFSAGADLRELVEHTQGPAAELALAETLERLAALPMIVVAVLERFALGGGFLISLYCDLRIATTGTSLGLSKLARNWVPPWGLSRLALWLGPAKAQQFLLVHGNATAEEARQWGLVEHVVEPEALHSYLEQMTVELTNSPPAVIAEVKQFYAQWKGAAHAHWDRISAAAFARTLARDEAQAAIAAFVQRERAS